MSDPTQPNNPGTSGDQPELTPQWPSSSGQSAGESAPAFEAPVNQGPTYPATPPAYGPVPQTSNSAIISLVLAIVAWVICPIIPAIIALVFASKADREIAASNGWVTGGGLVTAAKIVAWINIGLYAAIIAVGVLVLILAAVGGAFR
jgi:hypothetical protein